MFPLRSVALEPPRGPRGSSVMESSPNDADETSWELFPGTPFKTRACCHPGLIELCDFAGDSWGRQVPNGTVARGGCDPEFPIDANGVGWRVRAELPNHQAKLPILRSGQAAAGENTSIPCCASSCNAKRQAGSGGNRSRPTLRRGKRVAISRTVRTLSHSSINAAESGLSWSTSTRPSGNCRSATTTGCRGTSLSDRLLLRQSTRSRAHSPR